MKKFHEPFFVTGSYRSTAKWLRFEGGVFKTALLGSNPLGIWFKSVFSFHRLADPRSFGEEVWRHDESRRSTFSMIRPLLA